MQTYKRGDTAFLYNSDLSGPVTIQRADGSQLSVPGAHLLDFVACWVAQQRMTELEEASTAQVLGVKEVLPR